MTRALPSKFIQSMPEPDESLTAIRETVVALKRNMEVLTGQAKPPGTTAVTWDDLVALGFADSRDAPVLNSGSGSYFDSEIVQSAAIPLTTATLVNVTSIPLTPGTWDVFFSGRYQPAAGTTITGALFSISTASATNQDSPNSRQSFLPVPNAGLLGAGPSLAMTLNVGPARIVVTAATTIFAVARATFSGGTLSAYGHLQARRN